MLQWQTIKIVVVGDGAVGKTSLVMTYVSDTFPGEYIPYVAETCTKNRMIDGTPITLELWDTPAQDGYDRLRPQCYTQKDVFFICFCITTPVSLESVTIKVEYAKHLSHEEEEKIWDNDDRPPSYASLFGQFKEAKEKSEGPVDLLKTASQLFAGTIGCTIALSFLLAVPVAMIVVGVNYRNDCPVEPFIPIYLIVAGSCGLLKAATLLCQKLRNSETEQEQETDEYSQYEDISNTTKFIDGVLNIFMFTWFIAGNVWVYSHYKPNTKPPLEDPSNYCEPTVYWFAFWIVTVSYVIMGTICFCICCLGACASCTAFFVTKN